MPDANREKRRATRTAARRDRGRALFSGVIGRSGAIFPVDLQTPYAIDARAQTRHRAPFGVRSMSHSRRKAGTQRCRSIR
jgi:hypothetical protein